MLSDIEFQEFQATLLTPNIINFYFDFQLVSTATTFKVFQAKSRENHQIYAIRALDIESDAVKKNRNQAVTVFLQEILRFCSVHPELVVIEEFEIFEDKMVFVTKPHTTLLNILKECKQETDLISQIDVGNLVRNISSDLDFLLNKMRFTSVNLECATIFKNSSNNTYFLGDWINSSSTSQAPLLKQSVSASESKKQAQKNAAQEIIRFGSILLMIHGVDAEYVEEVVADSNNSEDQNSALEDLISGLKVSKTLKKLLRRTFAKDPSLRPTLSELVNQQIYEAEHAAFFEEEKIEEGYANGDVDVDDNGVPYSYAKRLKIIPPQTNNNVLQSLSKHGNFKYPKDKDPILNLKIVPYKIFENGATYIGKWKDGKRNGYGKIMYLDGSQYEGFWRDNIAEGNGRLIHADGDIYDGQWMRNKANGKGFYLRANGTRNEGDWVDDKQYGFGIETSIDGSRYEGQYKAGIRHGKGKSICADGSWYDGDFANNAIEGFGTYNWTDGRKYKGDWKANKMSGKGEYSWSDGNRYIGDYNDGKKEGYGEFYWNDGRFYKGEWKNGKSHGIGIYKDANGEKRAGEWEDGKRTKWIV